MIIAYLVLHFFFPGVVSNVYTLELAKQETRTEQFPPAQPNKQKRIKVPTIKNTTNDTLAEKTNIKISSLSKIFGSKKIETKKNKFIEERNKGPSTKYTKSYFLTHTKAIPIGVAFF